MLERLEMGEDGSDGEGEMEDELVVVVLVRGSCCCCCCCHVLLTNGGLSFGWLIN